MTFPYLEQSFLQETGRAGPLTSSLVYRTTVILWRNAGHCHVSKRRHEWASTPSTFHAKISSRVRSVWVVWFPCIVNQALSIRFFQRPPLSPAFKPLFASSPVAVRFWWSFLVSYLPFLSFPCLALPLLLAGWCIWYRNGWWPPWSWPVGPPKACLVSSKRGSSSSSLLTTCSRRQT